MAASIITIRNVKSIQELEFEVPKQHGIFLLTGINGCGKTSLLASLYRIGNPNAFKELLKHTGSTLYDKCDGSIQYRIGNNSVTYTRKKIRWVPSPRKNTDILKRFGYQSVAFYPPSGERLYVHDEDLIETGRTIAAEDWLKDRLNAIFNTQRFTNLRKIRIQENARGRRALNRVNIAYIVKRSNTDYYTEKNFSFGEILVLNLLLKLHDIQDNELLLIDELEIALYPKALVALYRYLERIALSKQITIIVSTHSASLINIAKHIILLEPQDNGKTNVVYNCSSARALGEIALQDDISPDAILFVEDIMAKYYIKAIIQKINIDTPNIPDYRVIAVGPYTSVIQFHKQTQGGVFACRTKLASLLDRDVEDTLSYIQRFDSQSKFLQTYHELKNRINFLPTTPEIGICQYIEQNHTPLTASLKTELGNQRIDISSCIQSESYVSYKRDMALINSQIESLNSRTETRENATKIQELSGQIRKIYKNKYRCIVSHLQDVTQETEESINKILFKQYIDWWQRNNSAEFNRFKGLILSLIR